MWLLQISLPLSQAPDSFSLQSAPSHLLSAWAECVLDCSPSPICPWMPRLCDPGDAGPLTELGAAQTEQLYRAEKMKEMLKSRDMYNWKSWFEGEIFIAKSVKIFNLKNLDYTHVFFMLLYNVHIHTFQFLLSFLCPSIGQLGLEHVVNTSASL